MIETTIVIVVLGALSFRLDPGCLAGLQMGNRGGYPLFGQRQCRRDEHGLERGALGGVAGLPGRDRQGHPGSDRPALLVSGEWADLAVGLSVIAVVAGTRWPVWLRFQGGRGNTAGISALTLISFQTGVLLICIWFVLRLLTKSSFLTTRLTLLLLPIAVWIGTQSWWYALVGLALSVIYLSTQRQTSDDHLLLKEDWPSFWAFLTSPPRKSS